MNEEENARFKAAVELFCEEKKGRPYMSDKLEGFSAGWLAALAEKDRKIERLHGNLNENTERGTRAEMYLRWWRDRHRDQRELRLRAEADRDRWKARAGILEQAILSHVPVIKEWDCYAPSHSVGKLVRYHGILHQVIDAGYQGLRLAAIERR